MIAFMKYPLTRCQTSISTGSLCQLFCLGAAKMTHACERINAENAKSIIDSIDTVFTDCDGVLWNDAESIEGAPETIQALVAMGKRVFYVTNNSMKTRKEYMEKCKGMGLPAESEECVIGTAHTAARYIKDTLDYKGKVYCIGSTGLQQELDTAGIPHIGIGPDDEVCHGFDTVRDWKMDPEVKCVVVGYDKYFNYTKLARATSYITQPGGCHFIGTNIDSGLPMGDGRVMPGTGSLIRCAEFGTKRQATMIGKPSPLMVKNAMKEHNIDPARTIMFGDRCDTDVALAGNCGLRSLLVLSGFSTLDEVAQHRESGTPEGLNQVPDYYAPSLKEFGKFVPGFKS